MTDNNSIKILLIGTLGSGKTVLARALSEDTGYRLTSIDECRKRSGDGTVTGEYRAWTCFIEACNEHEPAIIEFSGGGPHVYAVRQALLQSAVPCYVFWLDPPLEKCIERASHRTNDVPTPFPWAPIDESIKMIYKGIETAWDNLWTKQAGIIATRIRLKGIESTDDVFKIVKDRLIDIQTSG